MHAADLPIVRARFELLGEVLHLTIDVIQSLSRLLDQVGHHLHCDLCLVEQENFDVLTLDVVEGAA